MHEYTHGLSNRLVVDAGGNSTLISLQAGAMGEAWSDYYALDYLVTKGMVTDTARNGEVLFEQVPVQRNRPITRSEAIDCLVSATGRLLHEGERSRRRLHLRRPRQRDRRARGARGQRDLGADPLGPAHRPRPPRRPPAIVTEAMWLSPADPRFLDERDAILVADQALYGGATRTAIWQVFAQRGMGWFASATDGSDTGVVEDFHAAPTGHCERTLAGTVTDDVTGEPIEGAFVRLPGHASE